MNPFIIQGYQGPDYFCDRESETAILEKNIRNGVHTAFFAQRRIGKTALIQHVFHLQNEKKCTCLYMDIYATQNLSDFTNVLANTIYRVFPEKKSAGKNFLDTIKLLRPVISFDELSGHPEISLDIARPEQAEKSIQQLLTYLDKQDKQVVIAIDEFQQILQYPEKNVEALLRTCIQKLKNICFIYCGSNMKMMQHLFQNAKRPFYASTSSIHLGAISEVPLKLYIKQHFKRNGMVINEEALSDIIRLTMRHTFYTLRLCNGLYGKKQKQISVNDVRKTLNEILKEQEGVFYQYRHLLTNAQWNLLRAIAKEEQLEKPYNKEFISRHNLGTPASVKRSLEALIEKEMIFYQASHEKAYYEVQDKFLLQWLKSKY